MDKVKTDKYIRQTKIIKTFWTADDIETLINTELTKLQHDKNIILDIIPSCNTDGQIKHVMIVYDKLKKQ